MKFFLFKILNKILFFLFFLLLNVFLLFLSTFNINNKNLFTTTEITTDFNDNNQRNDYIKNKFDENDLFKKYLLYNYYINKFTANKIQGKDGVIVSDLATNGAVGYGSSTQSLGENKYLIGTKNKGFWFLKFDDNGLVVQANKIQGSNVSVLTADGGVGWYSSIQSLGNNKYLVGTGTKGFWLLKFNDKGLVLQANKIKNENGVNVSVLTADGGFGWGSSIESLGDNKYLIGTNEKGFWFLKFDDDGLVVKANRIQDSKSKNVSDLTEDGDVGSFSSIQSLGDNKYLVGTYNKGFWLLKFNDKGLVLQANKIQDKDGDDVLELTTNDGVGFTSSIQSLGENKYLVGTDTKGFWLLKFNDKGLVLQANRIQDSNNKNVSDLTDNSNVGHTSSIQNLGNNKYLIGTKTKGFWFLKFDDDGLVVQANKIQGSNVSVLTTDGKVGWGSSTQSLGENKYLVGTYDKGFYLLEFNKIINQFDYFNFEKGDLIFKSLFGNSDINVFISKTADTVFTIEESTNKLTINKNKINNLSDDDKLNLINLINLFEFLSKYNVDSDISEDDEVLNFDFIKEILNNDSLSIEQKDIVLGLKEGENYTIYKDEDSKTIPIITLKDLTSENQITFKKLTQILKTITDDNDNSKKKKVIETFTNWLSVTLNLKQTEWLKLKINELTQELTQELKQSNKEQAIKYEQKLTKKVLTYDQNLYHLSNKEDLINYFNEDGSLKSSLPSDLTVKQLSKILIWVKTLDADSIINVKKQYEIEIQKILDNNDKSAIVLDKLLDIKTVGLYGSSGLTNDNFDENGEFITNVLDNKTLEELDLIKIWLKGSNKPNSKLDTIKNTLKTEIQKSLIDQRKHLIKIDKLLDIKTVGLYGSSGLTNDNFNENGEFIDGWETSLDSSRLKLIKDWVKLPITGEQTIYINWIKQVYKSGNNTFDSVKVALTLKNSDIKSKVEELLSFPTIDGIKLTLNDFKTVSELTDDKKSTILSSNREFESFKNWIELDLTSTKITINKLKSLDKSIKKYNQNKNIKINILLLLLNNKNIPTEITTIYIDFLKNKAKIFNVINGSIQTGNEFKSLFDTDAKIDLLKSLFDKLSKKQIQKKIYIESIKQELKQSNREQAIKYEQKLTIQALIYDRNLYHLSNKENLIHYFNKDGSLKLSLPSDLTVKQLSKILIWVKTLDADSIINVKTQYEIEIQKILDNNDKSAIALDKLLDIKTIGLYGSSGLTNDNFDKYGDFISNVLNNKKFEELDLIKNWLKGPNKPNSKLANIKNELKIQIKNSLTDERKHLIKIDKLLDTKITWFYGSSGLTNDNFNENGEFIDGWETSLDSSRLKLIKDWVKLPITGEQTIYINWIKQVYKSGNNTFDSVKVALTLKNLDIKSKAEKLLSFPTIDGIKLTLNDFKTVSELTDDKKSTILSSNREFESFKNWIELDLTSTKITINKLKSLDELIKTTPIPIIVKKVKEELTPTIAKKVKEELTPTITTITSDFINDNKRNDYIKNKLNKNDLLKKYLLNIYYTNKLKNNDVGLFSSIQRLEETNKYLVGTNSKGFYLLKFNDNGSVVQVNKIQDKNGVNISDLTTDGNVGSSSSIQYLEHKKYLVGTGTEGFWLLEFDNDKNKFSIAKRIEGTKGVDVLALTSGFVGWNSSIQSLGDDKYLVGTGTKGFWLLEFDNDKNKFSIAKRIEGTKGVDVLALTSGFVGWGSSIQKLGENKYLVGTNHKGFWLLEFNDDTDKFSIAKRIEGAKGVDVLDLVTNGDVGWSSSIQDLGDNKYLVGTNDKGFWLLKFNDDTDKFSIAKKIEGKDGVIVSDLATNGDVGWNSSIQSLGDDKYLVGTGTKGFWLLEFDDNSLVVKAEKIKNSSNKTILELTKDTVGYGSSIQKLGDTNKYLIGTKNKGFWLLEFDDNKNQFDYFSFKKGDLIFNSLFGSFNINDFINKTADTIFTIEELTDELTINKNKINSLSGDNKLNLINLINLFEFLSKYNIDSDISDDDKVLNFDFIKKILKDDSINNKDETLGLKGGENYTIYKDEDSKTTPIFTSNDLISENQITLQKLTQKLKNIEDNNKKKKVIETFTNWFSVILNSKQTEWEKSKKDEIIKQPKTSSTPMSEEPKPIKTSESNELKIIVSVVVIGLILLLISTFFIIKYKRNKLKNKK